jgi:hypothetical protein
MKGIGKYLIIFLLLTIIFSCVDDRKFYKGIKSYYIENCSNRNKDICIVSLKDIIKMDWDSVYLIRGSSNNENIKNLKNIDLTLLLDPAFGKIIFIKKSAVIYQEEVYPQGVDFFDFSSKSDNTLILNFDQELHLAPKQANFKLKSEDGKLFQLKLNQ